MRLKLLYNLNFIDDLKILLQRLGLRSAKAWSFSMDEEYAKRVLNKLDQKLETYE